MASILNIIAMNHSIRLRDELELDREKRKEQRKAQCADVTQEIRDNMTQEEYDAWWTLAPENKFYDAACDQLLAMKSGEYKGIDLDALAEKLGESWQAYFDAEETEGAATSQIEAARDNALAIGRQYQAVYEGAQ